MKTLTFLAAGALLATCATAHAQSASGNVTLFGAIDLDLTYGRGALTRLVGLGNSGLTGSRLGVRGSEDLGDGWRAGFVVEHGYSPDTGAATAVFWNRQVFVSIGNTRLGEVAAGRLYTPTFLVHATYDAFGPQGSAAQQVLLGSAEFSQPTNIRASNAVNYTAPTEALGGFSLQALVAAGEGAATGKHAGIRAGYTGAAGAIELALGRYGDTGIGDLRSITLGARYKIGDLTLFGLHDRADSGRSVDTRGSQLSLSYAVGPTDLKASIAQSERWSASGAEIGTTRRYGLGAVHNLSRRTALYTSLARVTNAHGASTALNGAATSVNGRSTGVDVGIRHWF